MENPTLQVEIDDREELNKLRYEKQWQFIYVKLWYPDRRERTSGKKREIEVTQKAIENRKKMYQGIRKLKVDKD